MTAPAKSEAIPDKIAAAVGWLRNTPRDRRGPAVPALRRRFGLSTQEAVEAIRIRNVELARAS
jgi:hypothetical protein